MDSATSDRVINEAAAKVIAHNATGFYKPTDVAELVKILGIVFTAGYEYGLKQGHHNNEAEG